MAPVENNVQVRGREGRRCLLLKLSAEKKCELVGVWKKMPMDIRVRNSGKGDSRTLHPAQSGRTGSAWHWGGRRNNGKLAKSLNFLLFINDKVTLIKGWCNPVIAQGSLALCISLWCPCWNFPGTASQLPELTPSTLELVNFSWREWEGDFFLNIFLFFSQSWTLFAEPQTP